MAAPNPSRSLSQAQRLAKSKALRTLCFTLDRTSESIGGLAAIESLIAESDDAAHVRMLLSLVTERLGEQIAVARHLAAQALNEAASPQRAALYQIHPSKG